MQPAAPPMDSPTTELRIRGGAAFPWIIVIVAVISLAVLFGGGWLTLSRRLTPEERRARASIELATLNKEFSGFAESTVARTEWEAAKVGLIKFQGTFPQLAKATAAVEEQLRTLGMSEEGRRVASLPDGVAMYVTVRDHPRLTTEELTLVKNTIASLKAVADRALAELVVIEPTPEFMSRLEGVETELAKLPAVEQDLESLRLLVDKAKSGPPAAETLEAAITTWQRERAEKNLADQAASQLQLQAEIDQRLQVQTLETERREQEAALASKSADQSLRAQLAEARSEKEREIIREAEEKLAAVRARFELETQFQAALPEIRSLLAPMITPGKMQLGGDPFGWTPGAEGPLSLSQLERFGALQPNKETLLGTLFCGPTTPNDRPFGTFPERVPYNDGKFKRAQELLIEFGDLLVEQGMLQE